MPLSYRKTVLAGLSLALVWCVTSAPASATNFQLTVTLAGGGSGTVVSNPAGITCKPTCTASFAAGTQVKLTATPAKGSFFASWSGACKSGNPCTVTVNSNLAVTATFKISQTVNVLNHIIFMAQENRGLDH